MTRNFKNIWSLNDVAIRTLNRSWSNYASSNDGQGNLTDAWFMEGNFSTTERIIFAQDTTLPLLRGNSLQNIGVFGVGNAEYAWVGGQIASATSVRRITFANDLVASERRGNMTRGADRTTASGNSTSGWIFGGTGSSVVMRITYVNDVTVAPVRSSTRSNIEASRSTGNATDAWVSFGGLTSVDRIIFANDIVALVSKGNMPSIQSYSYASGNSSDGWFAGGFSSNFSRVARITFANDTVAAQVRGGLTVAINQGDASGNSTDMWLGSGINASLTSVSTTQRIIFASDTSVSTSRSTNNTNRSLYGASS